MRIGPIEFSFRPHNSRSKKRVSVHEFGGQAAGIEYVGDLIIKLEALQGISSNRYITRLSQVQETIRKYRGQAAKGNVLARNILETRAAFTVGRGLSVRGWDEGTAERQFVDEFMLRNRFSMAYLRRLGRERCFEGQILLVLNPGGDGVPQMRFISWADTKYEVQASPVDYAVIDSIRWDGRGPVNVQPGRSAFMSFHSRLNSHEGTPLFAGVLGTLEDLDDLLSMMRTINRSQSNPTPYFEFENENDAMAFRDWLKSSGWTMGTALAGAGKPSMIQLGYGPYTSIESNSLLLVKIISGHTGVPPHYFGFSELLNNRAVADDIRAMYVTIGDTEIDQWSQGFTDLLGRAMAMYNEQTGSTLKTQIGQVAVEQISEEQFSQVLQVWLPIWLGGGISTETLLAKLPGVDEKVEAARVIAELKERQGLTPGELLPSEREGAIKFLRAFSTK